MSLMTMSGGAAAVLSANRASAEPGEPTAASIAWTSDDPVVVQARGLIKQGQLTEAEKLLKRDDPSASEDAKIARQETIEIIHRLRIDYSLSATDLLKRLRQRGDAAVSAEQLEQWRKDGGVQWRMIDGQVAYFRREPANMNRFCAPYKEQVAGRHRAGVDAAADRDAAAKPGEWRLVDHLQRVADEAERTGQPYVLPVKMHVKFTVTIPAEAKGMKPGSLVRAWLPYPQEYGKRQYDVKLISASPSSPQIAPPAKGEHPMSGAPQRTAYFEARVSDPVKPVVFTEVFEYTCQSYYPQLDEAKALPLPADYRDGNLGERLPHIAFTPELKAKVAEIIGGETNPLAQARKIFHWISTNVAYHAEQEYCTLPSFSEACFDRRRGDCGVQSTLFITMCRAAGIPARWQSGYETKPNQWDMHDWAEFYVAPWGWLPADQSYGVQKSDDPRIRDFYVGHIDSYRMIISRDWGTPFQPPKHSLRSEPADLQKGEVEIDGKNLYYDQWDYDIELTWGSKP
jgi:transglutaminase-like putative cysteine protease